MSKMKKLNYKSPTLIVVNVLLEQVIAASVNFDNDEKVTEEGWNEVDKNPEGGYEIEF